MGEVGLTLICHGATEAVRRAAFPADEALDQAGLAAAAAAGRSAAGRIRRVDAAWTSPALRARQTTAALGLVAEAEPLLRDLDCGRWAGRALDEVAAAEPDAMAVWLADPAAAPHGGESVAALLGRVDGWLAGLAPGRVVAVTHPAVLRAAVLRALGAPAAGFWRVEVAPLGRVRLRGRGGRWTLLSLG